MQEKKEVNAPILTFPLKGEGTKPLPIRGENQSGGEIVFVNFTFMRHWG